MSLKDRDSVVAQLSIETLDPGVLYLIYDGDCLLCRNTALALRLKQQVKELVLINAREQHPLVRYAREHRLDLNEGVVVFYAGTVIQGAMAFQRLAALADSKSVFNQLMFRMFRHRFGARACYPFFRLVRRLLLWVRGKKAL